MIGLVGPAPEKPDQRQLAFGRAEILLEFLLVALD